MLAKLLREEGADPDGISEVPGHCGVTALICAAQQGHIGIMNLLLGAHADVDKHCFGEIREFHNLLPLLSPHPQSYVLAVVVQLSKRSDVLLPFLVQAGLLCTTQQWLVASLQCSFSQTVAHL